MPTTLAGSMLAVLALACLACVCALAVRRWGTGPAPDPFVSLLRRGNGEASSSVRLSQRLRVLADAGSHRPALEAGALLFAGEGEEGRRGLFRRRRERVVQEPAPEAPEAEPAVPAPPPQAPPVSKRRVPRPRADHVPLGDGRRKTSGAVSDERMRDRFRRGLRKTREFMNRDVREVFGAGPVPEAFDGLEEVLVRADVGVASASALADELRAQSESLTSDTLLGALRDVMRGALREADRRLRVNPDGLSVWLVVGVNGTGKTTTVAKLAAHAASQGFGVCIAAADTFRAAAIEQLETWGRRIGADVVSQHPAADPAAVVFDAIDHARARGYDLVVVDTAGRLHTRTPLMDELRKIRRVIEREPGLLTETLLVLDATTGQNGLAQARAFREAVDVTGLVLAKLDGTARGGIVFAVERELGIPVKAVGLGERPEDLAPFDPEAFVDALFTG